MPADSKEPDCLLRYQRPEDEAVVDLGGTSNVVNIHYEPEELEGHRTLYVGVRMPLVRPSHRHHRTHGQRHRKRDRAKESIPEDHETHDTPSQRVQFILGMEEDEEHVPHDLFTEMDEICVKEGEEANWKETARWVKFEEDVEDGGERWSKPYVATLSLHSLFELRSCIINGIVLLDMSANSTEEIAGLKSNEEACCNVIFARSVMLANRNCAGTGIIPPPSLIGQQHEAGKMTLQRDSLLNFNLVPNRERKTFHLLGICVAQQLSLSDMVLDQYDPPKELDENTRKKVWETLLKKHHHQNEKKKTNLLPIVRSFAEVGQKKTDTQPVDKPGITSLNLQPPTNTSEMRNGLSQETTPTDLSRAELHFMKKIPVGAEASNVLIGEVDFLTRPIVAFVRLTPAVLLSGMTEVPIPTRFLFILLGPIGKGQQYHEIGRSIATLMTDEIFHDVAYKAKDRNDLLAGIDEFLDQVTVLPPGEWDPSIRIEPPKHLPSQISAVIKSAFFYERKIAPLHLFLSRKSLTKLVHALVNLRTDYCNALYVGLPLKVASEAAEKRKMPGTPGIPNGSICNEEIEDHRGPELQRTGRLFGGLIMDVKRKAPWYWSDYKDALNLQCLASFLFLYCACMSPVITFGGLLGEATEGQISAIESLLGASMTGVVYSIFAGQPLTILGSTGPVLVFEKILFAFCKDYKLSYLSLRTCIGLWTTFMCILLVATDASSLVCYITRFTEEAFASLICLIFIFESLEKLFKLGRMYPVHMHSDLDQLTLYYCRCSFPENASEEALNYWNSKNITPSAVPWANLTVSQCQDLYGEFKGPTCGVNGPMTPDVLFWCCILFFSTVILSSLLKTFKGSNYFPTKVRSMIGDFAIFITIVIMVAIDYLIGIPSPKLKVPTSFQLTRDDRDWLVSPIGTNPWWTVVGAIIPALLCTILIFMDQQITAVIVNRKEHKLKKGCGYHLDLLMVGIMLGICSIMGLPWFVAATVLSISHVNSLKVESTITAPGEQPKFLGIREQRATGVMIFVLMGLSVFLTAVLQFIPMAVLYGLFLYMGVSSLRGIQFFDRLKLFGMPPKHQPDFIYLRHVPLRKVHLFTAIQLICLILLWVIKASPAAIVFPMMVLALVFVRKVMDFCFSKRELSWLDDLMPESKKKKLDDQNKEAAQEEESDKMMEPPTETVIDIPVVNANYLTVPGRKAAQHHSISLNSVRPDPADINISEEMPKTAMWKTLTMNTEKQP